MARTAKTSLKVVIARDSAQYPQPVGDFDLQDSSGNPVTYDFELASYTLHRTIDVPLAVTTTFGTATLDTSTISGQTERQCILVNSGPSTLYVATFQYYSKPQTDATAALQAFTYTGEHGATDAAGITIPSGGMFIIPVGVALTVKNADTVNLGKLDLFVAYVDDDLLTDLDDNV